MATRYRRRILGLMSGTSCDGVDAALVDLRGRGLGMKVSVLRHVHHDYPASLRRRLLAVMAPAQTTTQELCELNVLVGEAFGKAALKVMKRRGGPHASVGLIGSHGQTICHRPPSAHPGRVCSGMRRLGSTLQIGDAAVIAARTGVPVVSDFRQADVAVGGQGAPLVPWTDYVLFRHPRCDRVIQNIGGIANLTYLPADGGLEDVIAFDTGPGNMVIDELVRRITRDRRSFDRWGEFAGRGRVDFRLLREWMRHPFLGYPPPKSCGREQFGADFVGRTVRARDLAARPNDLVATATALTAKTISDAYRRFLPSRHGSPAIDQVVLCGGGSRNTTLVKMLKDELPGIEVLPIDRLGIPDQAKEGVSFAMLAAACVDGVPANLPQVTGASCAVILGRMTPVVHAR